MYNKARSEKNNAVNNFGVWMVSVAGPAIFNTPCSNRISTNSDQVLEFMVNSFALNNETGGFKKISYTDLEDY
jgi:hypothetical protein